MHLPISARILAPVVLLIYRALRRVVPRSIEDPHGVFAAARAGEPFLFVCRHGQLLPLLWVTEGLALTVLVSNSSDGEILARTLRARGFRVARGSGSRQAFSAARAALRVLQSGASLGLASDGPRGPLGTVHAGVLQLARRSGIPVVTLRVDGGWRPVAPGSWDRFEFPLPGPMLRVSVGEPLHIEGASEEVELQRRVIAQQLSGFAPMSAERSIRHAPGFEHL